MKNIVLIGMPGAGKSTIGVVLAKILGYQFLDSDLLIQQQAGKVLHKLIKELGDEGFLALENQVNAAIHTKQTVISTGGSAVYCEEAMMALKKEGWVIYLELSYERFKNRLGDLTDRGVVMRHGDGLNDLFDERCPLYERYADTVVNIDGLSIEQSIQKVKETVLGLMEAR